MILLVMIFPEDTTLHEYVVYPRFCPPRCDSPFNRTTRSYYGGLTVTNSLMNSYDTKAGGRTQAAAVNSVARTGLTAALIASLSTSSVRAA